MQEVYDFLKKCGTYYLATVENGQPRVRPFGTVSMFENKLYLQTGKSKDVFKQLCENPKVELCALADGCWLRVSGTLVCDDRTAPQKFLLDQYPELQTMYQPDDGNTAVLYFQNASATLYSFTSEPRQLSI